MDGSFACPDCGCEIRLTGLSPGREVRCGWCQSVVEIPFIPRADQITRKREGGKGRRRTRWPAWANLVVVVLAVAILLAGAGRFFRYRRHSAEAEDLARLVASARDFERSGKIDEAFVTMERAIRAARSLRPPPPDLDELSRYRDTLSRRDAERLLNQWAKFLPTEEADPGPVLAPALELQTRAGRDPSLAGMGDAIRDAVDRLRERWSEADGLWAKQNLTTGFPDRAMRHCLRMHANAEGLPDPARKRLQDEAAGIATRLIETRGVVVDAAKGQFTHGSAAHYDNALSSLVNAELIKHAYLPRTGATPWDNLWLAVAPYRITIRIDERQEENYLDSQNRMSTIDSRLALAKRGETVWYEAPTVRTQVPLPGLPALQASRLAAGGQRSEEFEKLLHKNAYENIIDQLVSNLRNLPSCRAPGT